MTAPQQPIPGRRNPLLDAIGDPDGNVDIRALYAQFARQDRMMLVHQARAEKADDLEQRLKRINPAAAARAAELEDLLGPVPPTGAPGRRIAAIAAWLRRLAADIDDPVPPDPEIPVDPEGVPPSARR